MAWPKLIKRTVTCPKCSSTAPVEMIHQPHQRVDGNRDRIYKSLTWADCPKCGHEWELRDGPSQERVDAE
ncbi:MAG: hypothetical protein A2284_15040 [Deltaproteobacteria bacterium RIFOXYA12_FULL_61_11]|nr:MAG: hypothetical protein A2284_15040 [Deltaproteobacteria bacterium RIFOXYA12_FULL_61_11]